MSRQNEIRVRLTDDELTELDGQRNGVPRAVYLRSLIHKAPEVVDVASREESLALLTSMARDDKVTGAIALERALRGEDLGTDGDDLLTRILGDDA